jgi:hypothetical protein
VGATGLTDASSLSRSNAVTDRPPRRSCPIDRPAVSSRGWPGEAASKHPIAAWGSTRRSARVGCTNSIFPRDRVFAPDAREADAVAASRRSTSQFLASSVWDVSTRFRLQIGMIPRCEQSFGTPHPSKWSKAGASSRGRVLGGMPLCLTRVGGRRSVGHGSDARRLDVMSLANATAAAGNAGTAVGRSRVAPTPSMSAFLAGERGFGHADAA